MGIDIGLLREQCQRTLARTQLEGLGQRIEAKVRDNYIQQDRRVIVVSDRVSAFDVFVGTLPFKGQILNQLAAFWFEKTKNVAPNHLIAVPDPPVLACARDAWLPRRAARPGGCPLDRLRSRRASRSGGISAGREVPQGLRELVSGRRNRVSARRREADRRGARGGGAPRQRRALGDRAGVGDG